MVERKEVAKYFKEEHLTRPLIKYIFYPMAVFVSWVAVSFKIHAHFVNLLGLLTAIISAIMIYYLDGYWMIVAGLLFLFGLVIDLSDGTVARFYNKKNAMGKWLDESTGIIAFSLVFFVLMIKTFVQTGDLTIIFLGTYNIFSYTMINYAALLSDVLRKKFNLVNPIENVRKKASKSFFGINPGAFAFSLDIQWTLVSLGVIFNQPYLLFIIFGAISSVQWMSRYITFWGK
ncbi:CDP-alcohol phosphatidyltransferase family protein [Candidatus Pacearchaeota archaeon]|nr:CDP-alcohol phosphatidyltransferase family protein [Candidatus Pacearchaeota archaeon]